MTTLPFQRKMRSPPATWLLLLCYCYLLFSARVHAGKQRDEDDDEEEPTLSPTAVPTMAPTATPSLPVDTTVAAPDNVANSDYTLDVPQLNLFFAVPTETELDLTALEDDWKAMLSNVLQVAAAVPTTLEWTVWQADTTYTPSAGQGLLRASGQITITNDRRRQLLPTRNTMETVAQADMEGDLYDYFLVWGVDDAWEYLVSRGYPVLALRLQMSGETFDARGQEPENLASLLGENGNGGDGDDKRNAWIAGVVMAIVVVIVGLVATLLYVQRRGRHTSKKEGQSASSPRTAVASDPASPRLPLVDNMSESDRQRSPLQHRDAESGISGAMLAGEEGSSVPGYSDCSFLYDASRLDSVISSAKDYELPYEVPKNIFSDLTMEGGKDAAAGVAIFHGEEEEDDIVDSGLVSDLEIEDEFKDEEPKARVTEEDPKNLSALLNSSDDTSDAFSEIAQFKKSSEPKVSKDPETKWNQQTPPTDPEVPIAREETNEGLYNRIMMDEEKKTDEGDESLF